MEFAADAVSADRLGINDRAFAISDKQDQEDDVDVKAVLADIAERMGYC